MRKSKLTTKITGTLLLLFLSASLLCAQNGRVEVTKDFNTDLTGAKKGTMKIDFSDTLRNFNLNMKYKILERQMRDLYSFTPTPSANISSTKAAETPEFAAKVGFGLPTAPSIGFYYQPTFASLNTDATNLLTLKANYDGYFGKARLAGSREDGMVHTYKDKAKAYSNKAGVSAVYTTLWADGQVDAEAFYNRGHYTYYGVDLSYYIDTNEPVSLLNNKSYLKDNQSHTYNQAGVKVEAKSSDAEDYDGKFRYNAKLSVTYTGDDAKFGLVWTGTNFKYGLDRKESLIKASIEAGPTIGKYSMVTIGVNSESSLFSGSFGDKYNFSLLDASLSYKLRRDKLSMDLGAKVSFNFNNKSGTDRYHHYVFPKVSILYEMTEGATWGYLNADGGNDINSYASLLERCPYIYPLIDIRESSTPVEVKAGIKGIEGGNFSYNFYLGGAYRKGLLQFYGNPINAIYSNHVEFNLGFQTDYKTRGFAAGAGAKYSFYSDGKMYRGVDQNLDGSIIAGSAVENLIAKGKPAGYPPFEANLYAEWNWDEKLFIGATLYGRSKTMATPFTHWGGKTQKYKGYANVSLYAQYAINNNFTAYAFAGNLLNKDIINYGMYVEKGINGGLGVLIKF
ncbi:MAG: TonB-dependent receptor [Bacteroidales bacterium]|nr:TonB-dependent receptor [Bacteroidales bacterium]